jgi:hypothetical protein
MIKYYVSLKGSDTNPGTLENPFRTFERAEDITDSSEDIVDIIIVD